ncbi:MAG: hypothetical protein K6F50_08330 [Kiritimatiellae bacterium]|nr:hypothetical protein [Kiritimatiellia bacterium]
MSYNMDISSLNAFRKANFASMNEVANSADGKVSSAGAYKGGFSALFRKDAERHTNNATRTEFLRQLGNAFNVEGMTVSDDGTVKFSAAFMDKLEKIIGPEFKRKDFGVPSEGGAVSSGKPLTARRISAIVRKASIAGQGGFDADVYRAKFDELLQRLAPKSSSGFIERCMKEIKFAQDCLEFVDKKFEKCFMKNDYILPENSSRKYEPAYVFVHPETEEIYPLMEKSDIAEYIGGNCRDANYQAPLPGAVFHTGEYKNVPKELRTEQDVEFAKNYIKTTIITFVQGLADLLIDAKDAGKLEEVAKELGNHPGACMDGKASLNATLRKEFGLYDTDTLDAITVAEHDSKTNLDKCIFEEIKIAVGKRPGAKGWDDIAPLVKNALVGVIRPISVLNENGEIVPLMNDGVRTVRAITEADLDALGPVCADMAAIF